MSGITQHKALVYFVVSAVFFGIGVAVTFFESIFLEHTRPSNTTLLVVGITTVVLFWGVFVALCSDILQFIKTFALGIWDILRVVLIALAMSVLLLSIYYAVFRPFLP